MFPNISLDISIICVWNELKVLYDVVNHSHGICKSDTHPLLAAISTPPCLMCYLQITEKGIVKHETVILELVVNPRSEIILVLRLIPSKC